MNKTESYWTGWVYESAAIVCCCRKTMRLIRRRWRAAPFDWTWRQSSSLMRIPFDPITLFLHRRKQRTRNGTSNHSNHHHPGNRSEAKYLCCTRLNVELLRHEAIGWTDVEAIKDGSKVFIDSFRSFSLFIWQNLQTAWCHHRILFQ